MNQTATFSVPLHQNKIRFALPCFLLIIYKSFKKGKKASFLHQIWCNPKFFWYLTPPDKLSTVRHLFISSTQNDAEDSLTPRPWHPAFNILYFVTHKMECNLSKRYAAYFKEIQTSFLFLINIQKLNRLGPSPTLYRLNLTLCKKKCYTWHVTCDMWHLTCATWWEVNILSKFQLHSSYGLGETVSGRSLNQWMNK